MSQSSLSRGHLCYGISLDDEKVLEYIKDEMNKEEIEATREQLVSNLNNEKNLTKKLTFKRMKAAYPSK